MKTRLILFSVMAAFVGFDAYAQVATESPETAELRRQAEELTKQLSLGPQRRSEPKPSPSPAIAEPNAQAQAKEIAELRQKVDLLEKALSLTQKQLEEANRQAQAQPPPNATQATQPPNATPPPAQAAATPTPSNWINQRIDNSKTRLDAPAVRTEAMPHYRYWVDPYGYRHYY